MERKGERIAVAFFERLLRVRKRVYRLLIRRHSDWIWRVALPG
jgi:hypothetical protein